MIICPIELLKEYQNLYRIPKNKIMKIWLWKVFVIFHTMLWLFFEVNLKNWLWHFRILGLILQINEPTLYCTKCSISWDTSKCKLGCFTVHKHLYKYIDNIWERHTQFLLFLTFLFHLVRQKTSCHLCFYYFSLLFHYQIHQKQLDFIAKFCFVVFQRREEWHFAFSHFFEAHFLGKVEILQIHEPTWYCTKCSISWDTSKSKMRGFHGT